MSYADIPGYSGFLWLYEEAARKWPRGTFVEVGVALGHSIAYLAEQAPEATIYAVDPWAGQARNGEQQEALLDRPLGDFRLFLDNMIAHAPRELERIRVWRMSSIHAAFALQYVGIDMVLIDGAHDFESVKSDITCWMPRLRPGGWLAGDDHDPKYPGVQEACELHFGKGGYEVKGTTWRVQVTR